MPTLLSEEARDKGTYIVEATFKDENDDPVTPDTLIWSLTDGEGNVINNREDISETPGTVVSFVLAGDDLKYADGPDRSLIIEATYTSVDHGASRPLNDSAHFRISDIETI